MRLRTASFDRIPWVVLTVPVALAAAGLAAINRAEELMEVEAHFWTRQAVWCIASAVVLLVTARTNYRRLVRYAIPFYGVLAGLLIAVFWLPPINGAHRWLRLFGFGVQPSEFMKLAVVLVLARYLKQSEQRQELRGLAMPFALTLVPMLLILREPDLGTSLVFPPILLAMLIAAGARLRHLVMAGLVGLCLCPMLWTQMSREQRSRVTALWEQTGPGETPTDDGYHLHQSKQVLALGGIWGSALAGEVTSDRSPYRLPVAHSDFIFAVIGERFGLWGACAVLAAFIYLIHQILAIGRDSREAFGRLMCVGVAALFSVEVLVNTAMTVGLAPVTGLSLPLISHGGSGLLVHAAALGLAASVRLHPGYEIGGGLASRL